MADNDSLLVQPKVKPAPKREVSREENSMRSQNERMVLAGLRRDFGEGLDDIEDNDFVEALHQVEFGDLDQDDFLEAIAKTYGGVYIKKPQMQDRLGKPATPYAQQMNVPVMPEDTVTAKAPLLGRNPVTKFASQMVGGFVGDAASIPDAARVLADDLGSYFSGRGMPEYTPQKREALTRGASVLASTIIPEMGLAKGIAKEGIKRIASHAAAAGAKGGAIYEGLSAFGEGAEPTEIAARTFGGAAIGGTAGAIIGAGIHKIVGSHQVEQEAVKLAEQARMARPAAPSKRAVDRGMTRKMEEEFSGTIEMLRSGMYDTNMAANEILMELGLQATPEEVAEFAAKLEPYKIRPTVEVPPGYGQLDLASVHTDRAGTPNVGNYPMSIMHAGTTIPRTPAHPNVNTPTVPDPFGQQSPESFGAPEYLPGDTPQQTWNQQAAHPEVDLHEIMPVADQRPVVAEENKFVQGYVPRREPTFTGDADQQIAKRKREADRVVGPPQQKLLPPYRERRIVHAPQAGAKADMSKPAIGITVVKDSGESLVVTRIEGDRYIGHNTEGKTVIVDRSKTVHEDGFDAVAQGDAADYNAPRSKRMSGSGKETVDVKNAGDKGAESWGIVVDNRNQETVSIVGEHGNFYEAIDGDGQKVIVKKTSTSNPHLKGIDAAALTGKKVDPGAKAFGWTKNKETGVDYKVVGAEGKNYIVHDDFGRELKVPRANTANPKIVVKMNGDK